MSYLKICNKQVLDVWSRGVTGWKGHRKGEVQQQRNERVSFKLAKGSLPYRNRKYFLKILQRDAAKERRWQFS
ncbi:hypothetical protein E2C01_022444 [Portunus trituberculatus]|uniref:Uncharacterized protein n=1 Tax=Portunus trituberculatus TaxID=210409 RepID=A0A5B7E5D2_PORTR|nr:hypothetical protein [Portunus trituberculatus]